MITGMIFGVFDLFHNGHYNALLECKKHCDVLYVGLFNDKAVEGYKRKPVWDQLKRRDRLLELSFVDGVILVDRKIFFDIDREIDVFFVSDDHKGKKLYCIPSDRYDDIVWIPYTKGISTTDLIKNNKDFVKWLVSDYGFIYIIMFVIFCTFIYLISNW